MRTRSSLRLSMRLALVLLLVAGVVVVPSDAALASDKELNYTFEFNNGVILTGTASDKTEFLADAGGTSVNNPAGMTVHLSCSDKFTDGWGQKDGPVEGVDTAWQLASYSIIEVKDGEAKKKCEDTFTPTTPPVTTPPSIDIEKFVNGDDADTPTGPELAVGTTAKFTYVVTNTGESLLSNVAVEDDIAGQILCPSSTLEAGGTMECDSTTMEVEEGQQTMKATVTAEADGTPPEPPVGDDKGRGYVFEFINGVTLTGTSTDKVHYLPEAGGTSITTPAGMDVHLSCSDDFTDGWGEKDGPVEGIDTAWQLASFSIIEFKDGEIKKSCSDRFAPSIPVVVMDMDPVFYVGIPNTPSIDLEKTVNGYDADDAPGPEFKIGDEIVIEYVVTNDGDVPLTNVSVVDADLGSIDCPLSELDPGESMTCDSYTVPPGHVQVGPTFMEATAAGKGAGQTVRDTDPINFVVVEESDPSIDIEKAVNGFDSDTPPGQTFSIGNKLTFTYVVTNTGNTVIDDIMVLDLDLGFRQCPSTSLAPGDSMDCESATITAEDGGAVHMESVVMGQSDGTKVYDTDPVNFTIYDS